MRRLALAATLLLTLVVPVVGPRLASEVVEAQTGHTFATKQVVAIPAGGVIKGSIVVPGLTCIGNTCEVILQPGEVLSGSVSMTNRSMITQTAVMAVIADSWGVTGYGPGIQADWLGIVHDLPGKGSATDTVVMTNTLDVGDPVTYTLTGIWVNVPFP